MALPVAAQRMESIDRYHGALCSEELSPYGFISDADWLCYRLDRARRRVDRLEIAFAAAREHTPGWLEAERELRFAREEVAVYDACLRELNLTT